MKMARRTSFYGFCVILSICVLFLLLYQPSSNQNDIQNNQIESEELLTPTKSNVYTIESLLAEQRAILDQEMENYNFLPGESLKSLTYATNGQPKKSIIITTWRSGSTFLGEILNAVPGSYYHYEPMSDYEIVQIRGPPESDKVLTHVKHILACNYTGMDHFLKFCKKNVWVLWHNKRLWDQCDKNQSTCFEPEFLNPFCQMFPFHLMKTVRLRLRLAEELLNDISVRILLLVRDPRGTLQSRKHRTWCPGMPDCDQPQILCSDLVSDFSAAIRLKKKYPDRFKVIRYEDLSLNPFDEVRNLLAFFQLDFSDTVREFLDNHTKFDMGGVSSTFRNSKSAPFHWRSDLEYDEISNIEGQCATAMNLWGYVKAPSLEHERKIFNPLTDYHVER